MALKTALDKLVRIGQLKAELRNDAELQRMLTMAQTRWVDAQLTHVLQEGRFTSAYNAAHAAALAALRWHGYRSENLFTVFQCLTHTVNWPPARRRVLDAAHQTRNLVEYEGYLEVEKAQHCRDGCTGRTAHADVQSLIGQAKV